MKTNKIICATGSFIMSMSIVHRLTIHYIIYYLLGLVICNWAVLLSILITIWCTFDAAGRSWVKMKKYQRSMRESESRFNYKRSGSMNRNWRQRSAAAICRYYLYYIFHKYTKGHSQQ